MAGTRMTLSTRNLAAVTENLARYGKRALDRAKVVVEESAERTYQTAQSLAPVDTGYMKDHMRKDVTRGGFGYEVGFREADFVGQLGYQGRDAGGRFTAGRVITEFYPLHQEWGTSTMAAQPCIFPAADLERPRFKQELREALSPKGRRKR